MSRPEFLKIGDGQKTAISAALIVIAIALCLGVHQLQFSHQSPKVLPTDFNFGW